MTAAEEETPWLRLARFSEDHAENKRLWNGYQKYLLRPHSDEYQRQLENPKFACIVDLSDAEIHSIQIEIPDLPKELEQHGVIALNEGTKVINTDLRMSGFYFAFKFRLMGTTLKGYLNLNETEFLRGVSFRGSIFQNMFLADKACFHGFANFFKCEFNSKLSCRSAVFAYAHFHSASFGYSCLFNNTSFVGGANFTDSNFANSVDFGSVGFHGVTFFNLTAASSAAVPISFNATKFCKHPPHFFGRALHEDTDWTGVKLPNARSKTAQCECLRENDKRADDTVQMADKPRDSKAQAALPRHLLEHDKRAYEQLRIKCGALGKVEDEHMFFRREMELTGRLSPWYTRVTYWLYHLVSDYGYSYWRPIAGMVGVWYFWSLFYALNFMARDQLHLCMDGVELFLSIAGLSFANIFSVFGFYRRFPSDLLADPTFVTVLLTVSETLLGFVFLFFLGLGLRTRFRLR